MARGFTGTTVDYPDRRQKMEEMRRPEGTAGNLKKEVGQVVRQTYLGGNPSRLGPRTAIDILGF